MIEDEIAKLILNPATGKGISPVTLRQHFRHELDRGHAVVVATVANSLYKNATTATASHPGGNPTAQIFMLKTRARWRERDPIGQGTDAPPPPPAESEEGMKDAAKRIAFMLATAARSQAPAPQKKPKAKTAA